ncbi:Acid phosphatase 1 [Hordeum vulgare]|nr:Acid phosphatase 1 [Hordeum vulgare]
MAAPELRRRWLVVLVVGFVAVFQAADGAPWFWPPGGDDPGGCLSWRVMVEANNAKFWRAVPAPCVGYVWAYMSWGQYGRDVGSAADQVAAYASQAPAAGDGLDAWVLDVDDTCLSNLPYYQAKQFGAYDPAAFKAWASRGACPGIPAMVRLFWALKGGGFRVFLLSGRDEEALGAATAANLAAAGFAGYDRLVLSSRAPGTVGRARWSSSRRCAGGWRRRGYRIRGNVGDQWSDLQGDCAGDRVFKVPNPMYFVP